MIEEDRNSYTAVLNQYAFFFQINSYILTHFETKQKTSCWILEYVILGLDSTIYYAGGDTYFFLILAHFSIDGGMIFFSFKVKIFHTGIVSNTVQHQDKHLC